MLVENVMKGEVLAGGAIDPGYGDIRAVDEISFTLRKGQVLDFLVSTVLVN
ncbi:MAG: hypothetical protein R3F44_01310 [Candidatus Competibacteraceae bacterium]